MEQTNLSYGENASTRRPAQSKLWRELEPASSQCLLTHNAAVLSGRLHPQLGAAVGRGRPLVLGLLQCQAEQSGLRALLPLEEILQAEEPTAYRGLALRSSSQRLGARGQLFSKFAGFVVEVSDCLLGCGSHTWHPGGPFCHERRPTPQASSRREALMQAQLVVGGKLG